jgi:hypothetical protein
LFKHYGSNYGGSSKNKYRPSYVSVIPLLDMHSKEYTSIYKSNTCKPMLIAALFTITDWVINTIGLGVPIDEWTKYE